LYEPLCLSERNKMLPFEKALEIVLSNARPLPTERVDIKNAANRILAEDVKSDIDIPPFNKSAMDGFACRRTDLGGELKVVEIIPAGIVPEKTIGKNECAKIMTGAMVPAGADCVVMKEYVETLPENTIRFIGEKTAENIRHKGEDVKAGETVLLKGTILRPQHIAVLASVGNEQPLVSVRPKVGVIATGDELVQVGTQPGPSQIRNSNTFQLAVQVENTGAIFKDYGIIKDRTDDIDCLIKKALDENDVVIISGGVSVGDFDFVPRVLKQNKVDLLFEKIAIKPGKPTIFGVSEKAFCFGMPGNPVSVFVIFEILVKPFIYKLMGHNYRPVNIQMPLDEPLLSKDTKGQRWIPVVITEKGTVKPVAYHGSAHINALCDANGLICIHSGVSQLEKGALIPIWLI
jgi:molybdopterin molybdotransferase